MSLLFGCDFWFFSVTAGALFSSAKKDAGTESLVGSNDDNVLFKFSYHSLSQRN